MGKKEFAQWAAKKSPIHPDDAHKSRAFRFVSNLNYNLIGDKGTATLEDEVKPEFIKGTKKYKPEGLKEIGEFISKNPKRFAKGVGKGLGGLALGALGVAIARSDDKPKKNK